MNEPEPILLADDNERFVFDISNKESLKPPAHIVKGIESFTVLWYGMDLETRCGKTIHLGSNLKQVEEGEVCSECLVAKNKLNHSQKGA